MPLNRLASRFISRTAAMAFSLLFAVAIFFRAESRLFGSPRRLLSFVDYFYVIIFFKRFSDIPSVLAILVVFMLSDAHLSAFRDRLKLTLPRMGDILSNTVDFCLFWFAAANGNCQGAAFISRKA